MKLENFALETTTTTGTGNITLAGAAANRKTLNNSVGVGPYFEYVILDDANSAREIGIGHLSDATTLVRDKVLESTNANAAVNLAAGTKYVFIGSTARSFRPRSYAMANGGSKYIPSVNWVTTQNASVIANRLYYIPYRPDYYGLVDQLVCNVQVASAGGTKCRIGLYTIGLDGLPAALVEQSTDLDPSTTGVKSYNLSTALMIDDCYLAFMSDAAPTMRSQNVANHNSLWLGVTAATFGWETHLYQDITAGWTQLPATPGALTFNGNNAPTVMARAA